jgi:hypothetical protein
MEAEAAAEGTTVEQPTPQQQKNWLQTLSFTPSLDPPQNCQIAELLHVAR